MYIFKVGIGYDVHRLVPDRPLILGGVAIPHHRGLKGHSDADVLVHAVMDALLGALALGDIGGLFPDTDETYKNADSLVLLERVSKLISEKGYTIGNIDATIIAEAPKCSPYIHKMRKNMAEVLNLQIECVSIKATTEEGLGFTGKKEGIAVQAIALVHS